MQVSILEVKNKQNKELIMPIDSAQKIEIERLFNVFESLIQSCLQGQQADHSAIMVAASGLSDEIELLDGSEYEYIHYQYRLHSTTESYLNSLDKKTEQHKKRLLAERKLAAKYEKLLAEAMPLEAKHDEEKHAETVTVEETRQSQNHQSQIEACIDSLGELLTKDIIDALKKQNIFLQQSIKTFQDYQTLLSMKFELSHLMDSIFADLSEAKSDNKNMADATATVQCIFDALIRKRIFEFVENLATVLESASGHYKAVLGLPANYHNKDEINKHFKKLFLYFHPDKFVYRERNDHESEVVNRLFVAFRREQENLIRGFNNAVLDQEHLEHYYRTSKQKLEDCFRLLRMLLKEIGQNLEF